MDETSFIKGIREIATHLESLPLSWTELNRTAARLDDLGRRLHRLDWLRADEIGRCLMTSVWELGMARGQSESRNAETLRRVTLQLDAAVAYAAEGLRVTGSEDGGWMPSEEEEIPVVASREKAARVTPRIAIT